MLSSTVLPADTIESRRGKTACESIARALAVMSASELFSDDLPQEGFVERQVGHQALQPRVLVTQLTQLLHFRHSHAAVALLPDVETRLTAAELPTHICRWRARLDLAQG